LTNPEVIAVDQDPAGVQGILVGSVPGVEGNLEVWCKPLGTDLTTKAVALFNRSSTNASITANWSDIGLQPGNATVRDLWARTDLGTFVNAYSAVVPTHGVKLLKIIGTGIVGQGSGAPSASFTASPITGAAPLTVTFADTSTGTISNWFWNFGDGNSTNATIKSMSHTYVTAGTYSVAEIVTGSGGSGSSTRDNYIIALTPLQALQFQAWQSQYFGCTNCQQAQLSMDADGTGQNNWFKYTAGLDPTNPASVFVLQITSVTNQPTQMNLLFNPMVAGRTYTPLISTNPVSGTWANLASFSGPVTNGNQVSITDTNAIEPQKFYRIGISLP
jgi:PKD repeat protein